MMLRSLRARLTGAVVGLSAVALIAAAAAVYVTQRNFVYDRIDDQLRSAVPGVRAELLPEERPPFAPPKLPKGADHLAPPGDGPGDGPGPGGSGRPRVNGGRFGLPPGTYGERRDARGTVVSKRSFSYLTQEGQRPALPSRLPVDTPQTVEGATSLSPRYRALATPTGDGGAVIAAVPLSDVDDTLFGLLIVQATAILAVLALLALVASRVVAFGLRPLARMAETADAIAGGDLGHRVADTDERTETGRLGRALNAMLDRLQQAFSAQEASERRLRQFLADASHELRTPLTSIRGYAELHRMGALADPDERNQAMQRIEDEAARMGVLVADLLALARLDEVQDTPHVAVDLASLVQDAAADARAAAPDRAVTVVSGGPAFVLGAPDQLRQVVANLCANARLHTPAGTPFDLAVEVVSERARVTVRDHGGGLPAGEPSQLFERFWRADGGRTRGSAGAGLGLAIVAAVIRAHNGTVRAENVSDGGAAFVIELPTATADAVQTQSQETPSKP